METMLKTGPFKILRLFYGEKNIQIHLRDIARKAGLNENSATRFLKQLEKQNILIFKKEGNLKRYRIKKNKAVYGIFSLFDIERYSQLPSKRQNAFLCFLSNLDEKPLIAVLFGSTAKESFSPSSDMDLLLVVNRKIKTENAENYAESQTGIRINCFQIIYSDFVDELKIKRDKVVQSALKTGYPIFNQIHFYEAYYNED